MLGVARAQHEMAFMQLPMALRERRRPGRGAGRFVYLTLAMR
jgi:hypothetical protein